MHMVYEFGRWFTTRPSHAVEIITLNLCGVCVCACVEPFAGERGEAVREKVDTEQSTGTAVDHIAHAVDTRHLSGL